MPLQVAAPRPLAASTRALMAPEPAQRVAEMRGQGHVDWRARMSRFPSATASGAATLVARGDHVDKDYLDATGFLQPLVIPTPAQVDLLVPTSAMAPDELTSAIGGDRSVRAIDVATQRELTDEWTLKRWMAYFAQPPAQREHVLNLISLECSGSRLEKLVRPPRFLREIGWVEKHWPPTAKTERPRVQLYCLMSAGGSYTEFHIDFGGSSVWYHLNKGRKIFFVIPPTEQNLSRFTAWETEYRHGQAPFFGDLVPDCAVIDMQAGDTLLLPSGWIHAVYTPEDSIAFGGNFLSGYHMSSHLHCHAVERGQNVEGRFHFPRFEQVVWHASAYYAWMLSTCRSALSKWEWAGLAVLVPALESWLSGENGAGPPDAELMSRVVAICKTSARSSPTAMLQKMAAAIELKRAQDLEMNATSAPRLPEPTDSLSPPPPGASSSSSSADSSSDSSDSSSSDSSDNEHGKDSDKEPPITEDDEPMDTNDDDDGSSSSDSSSESSSSSDNETGPDENEEAEPEEEKEEEEEEAESSSSESDGSDPESAYPELPPAPVDAIIAVRKQAKLKELHITKEGKEQVVAQVRERQLERQQERNGKKKKKKLALSRPSPKKSTGVPPVAGVLVVVPWAEDDSWMVECVCGLGGQNYDDGSKMVQCGNCDNWVHAACIMDPIPDDFWCFKCKASDDWMFVCPCGVRAKNYDDHKRMVQCEKCENWQHTSCVGIADDAQTPDDYRCPTCSVQPRTPRTPRTASQKKRKAATTRRKHGKATTNGSAAAVVIAEPAPVTEASPGTAATPAPLPPPPEMSPSPPPPSPPSTPPPPPQQPVVSDTKIKSQPVENGSSVSNGHRKRARSSTKRSKSTKKVPPPLAEANGSLAPPSVSSPADVTGIVRPPLPLTPKTSTGSGSGHKRKPSSARDRLEKKLKIRKPRN